MRSVIVPKLLTLNVAISFCFFSQILLLSTASATSELNLETYLKQVRSGNEGYLAATGLKAAALAQSAEPHLQFKPQVIANASFTSDAKPSPFFPYDRVETTNFNVGIQNQFKFGLMTKFTFGLTDFHYVGISPKYFEARPQMEASLPLMRNAFGRESRLGALAAEKSGLAKSSAHEAACRQILTEAETMYWRLSVAREVEKLAKNSLSRAQALFEWTSRRVRLSLSDKSEGLQATAQLKARQIDLRIAKEDTRSAALAFNAARGKSSDVVEESLPLPSSKLIANWRTPERLKNRPDVDLALAQAETMRATALASAERSRSQLELFGLYALNSPQRKTDTSALSDAWNANRPTSTIGVRLNVPLDRDTIKTVYDAWTAEATEQQSLANRKVFEQERDWSDAIARFGAAQEKLKLLEDLELTQKEKLDYERARQQRGRSTVAQVVLFEAEYDQTAFARVRALAEILNLNAQLKLFSTLASTN